MKGLSQTIALLRRKLKPKKEHIDMKRNEAIAAIESVRRTICPYFHRHSCDCKYGAHKGIHICRGVIKHEITGCCEIRALQELLLAMKDKEYDTITQRYISNEINDPGQRIRKLDAIFEQHGAGLKFPDKGNPAETIEKMFSGTNK